MDKNSFIKGASYKKHLYFFTKHPRFSPIFTSIPIGPLYYRVILMKVINLLFLCFILSLTAKAATSITTPTVSGHWTLAGSPYKIYCNISVPYGSSLTIHPGVEVIFQGAYHFNVSGVLQASGTATQRINFTINDTTGFSTDTITRAGGWGGIAFTSYSVPGDSSSFEYCNISYVKTDTTVVTALYSDRSIAVRHCNIFNNRPVGNYFASGIVDLGSFVGGPLELSDCNIYNNKTNTTIISIANPDGTTSFNGNSIHDNSSPAYIFSCMYVNMTFDNNDIYRNSSREGTILFGGAHHATMTRNKIHDNRNIRAGAIHSNGGFLDIYSNIICNNRKDSTGLCGPAYGGGAMFLKGSDSVGSSYFNVQNNIIANNYSADRGGAIEVFKSRATIANNTIINNKASQGGAVFIFPGLTATNVIVKNNILRNNISTYLSGPLFRTDKVGVYFWGNTSDTLTYDNNWAEQAPDYDIYDGTTLGYTFIGDVTTNIVGTDPGLVAPTLTCTDTENAAIANFALQSTSPCVNMGDTLGITVPPFDYAGNYRISGSAIDIGAYEYGSGHLPLRTPPAVVENKMVVYPNPANNMLFVAIPAANGKIQLFDITGKMIAEQNVTTLQTTFNIHNFPRGIYIAIWTDGTGTKATQKVIVE